jgi:hypothetical protein
MRIKRYLGLLLLCLAASGCPFDVHHLSSTPTRFTREVESLKWFALKGEVLITEAPCGYSRTLRTGSRWEQCGAIPEGEVYQSRDQVLTVECSNTYEAYLVVSDGRLNGFYLPVEKVYVSLPAKMDLPLR